MINLKSAFSIGAAALTTISGLAQKASSFKPPAPNIILILIDDMGYGDIGRNACYWVYCL